MPSSMVHISIAYQLFPDAPGLFGVGAIAPDYVFDRTLKDRLHLRNTENRDALLAQHAAATDPCSPYGEGWLLHLYTDAQWDSGPLRQFREAFLGQEDWFAQYRKENCRCSYWLFHQDALVQAVWPRVLSAPLILPDFPQGPCPCELAAFLTFVDKTHRQTHGQPSALLTPESLAAFSQKILIQYPVWRKENPHQPPQTPTFS